MRSEALARTVQRIRVRSRAVAEATASVWRSARGEHKWLGDYLAAVLMIEVV